ncbi:hypothetical protein FDB64_12300 [Clostridium botulinum]|uniref:hypothetical protein n=1 Tax=Clostridium botulinum TaxID=1491 RepID=UPI0013F0CB26|nr:hypothetical protein [Clostridium botulinum]MBY6917965.1 hypothetical protein [Clostridium botulinum]NFL35836.1 hypothetical protein [Clostridium botulinum]NFM05032.1 hypothetical protein [Clostridium botulinum]NFO40977.1 hypothetical protein [Clostridium botulinum]
MRGVNYWIFNLDYKNNNGDIVWRYCKNNNCFVMQYQEGKQNPASITKNLNIAREVRIGDYCVAYTGNGTIVGTEIIIKEFYEEDDMKKMISENAPNFERIGVKWSIKLEKELIINSFTKNLGITNQKSLTSSAICKISKDGYQYAENMCKKICK